MRTTPKKTNNSVANQLTPGDIEQVYKQISKTKPINSDYGEPNCSNQIAPTNYRNSPVIGDAGLLMEKGDASEAAANIVDILMYDDMFGEMFRAIKDESDIVALRMTPFDLNNLESLKRRFVGYIANCVVKDIKFGNLMVYQAIGINKSHAYDWENGRSRGNDYSDFIKKVKNICASYREYLGMSGKLNPVTLVWWQKNYDGLVDTQQVILRPAAPLGDEASAADLQNRIEGTVPLEPEE